MYEIFALIWYENVMKKVKTHFIAYTKMSRNKFKNPIECFRAEL